MGKFATAFRGVWGQVLKVEEEYIPKYDGHGRLNGHDRTNLYILTDLTYQGKRVVVKASPYELDGGLLDKRPVVPDRRR